ncbi:hypothetical protein BDN71DRAFT_1435633 [Pleurotus eryngii]|uniref:Uncharacterized protein n=1 Tax=Pleurotus eryngii TaxID=5323 RepID=A0A9P5ZJA6_PLEER|nr:hypothetical protein BDN71DRAFT_1435633 [Pleurotus eryngii]
MDATRLGTAINPTTFDFGANMNMPMPGKVKQMDNLFDIHFNGVELGMKHAVVGGNYQGLLPLDASMLISPSCAEMAELLEEFIAMEADVELPLTEAVLSAWAGVEHKKEDVFMDNSTWGSESTGGLSASPDILALNGNETVCHHSSALEIQEMRLHKLRDTVQQH